MPPFAAADVAVFHELEPLPPHAASANVAAAKTVRSASDLVG
jgi:hypothetical protein